jgi:hypothetical protein
MTPVEKNIVIVEFMGIAPKDYLLDGTYYYRDSPWFFTTGSYTEVQQAIVDYVKYHSSWDWLMPVIQKLFKYDVVFQISELEVKSAICYEPIEEVHQLVYHWIQKINKINEVNK